MIKLSKNDTIMCIVDIPLSTFNQNFFTNFYQPILTPLAYNLYLTFNSMIKAGILESNKIKLSTLLSKLNVSNLDNVLNSRLELEGLGLIETYMKQEEDNYFYIEIIKSLPTPYEFISNDVLNTLLKSKIDEDSYNNLIKEYIIHLYDMKSFENVTISCDEVFEASKSSESALWQDNSSKININNNHFDYEYVTIVLSGSTNLKQEFLKSVEFYNNLNRISWIYDLTDDELIEVVKQSIEKNIVDYELLRKNATKILGKRKVVVSKREANVESSSKVINTLNSITPSKLVNAKYHTSLTPSEVEMFDKLLVDTNISTGVLNVLIIYVMDLKNGEIPSYNYFLKIINTWIRKGIKTTEAALNELTAPKGSKTSKTVPSWYSEYLEEDKAKKDKKNKDKPVDDSSLEELEAFFNKEKK